jgi:hypothetical protein
MFTHFPLTLYDFKAHVPNHWNIQPFSLKELRPAQGKWLSMVPYITTELVRGRQAIFQSVIQQTHLYTLLFCTVSYLGLNGKLLFNVKRG